VGLTVFRDRELGNGNKPTPNDQAAGITSDPFTFKFGKSPYTSSSADYRKVLRSLKAEGGGDLPENSLEALKHAAAAETRTGVSRIMVLITDADAHKDLSVEDVRKALLEHKHHHVYLMCHKDHQATYEQVWGKDDKGHVVNGVWFDLGKDATAQKAAFAGVLDKVSAQASKDVIARRKKK